MNASMKVEPDLAMFREDLDALRHDVASLIEHMKDGATNTVQNAAGEVERRVRSFGQLAGSERDRSTKALESPCSEPTPCCADDRGRDRLRRRANASTVNQSSTAGDLFQIALAVFQPGAAPAEPRPAGSFSRSAVPQLSVLVCIAAALGCGLAALWILRLANARGRGRAACGCGRTLCGWVDRVRLPAARSRSARVLAASWLGFSTRRRHVRSGWIEALSQAPRSYPRRRSSRGRAAGFEKLAALATPWPGPVA